jgi:hypothetical protein
VNTLKAAAGAALLMAAACAGGPGTDRGSNLPRRPPPNLFISPAGQPYRAERGAPYPLATWFAETNASHDGRLTRAEFLANARAFFAALDQDHNGVVDGFELQRYEREVAPEINPQIEGLRYGEGMDLSLGREDQDGRRGEPQIGKGAALGGREQAGDRRPEGAGVFGLLNEPEPVAACDLAFNSRITLAEFLEVNDRRFTTLDRKGLGYLTLGELPKTPAQLAIERLKPRSGRGPGGGSPPPRPN